MPESNRNARDAGELIGDTTRATVARIVSEVLDRGQFNLQPQAAAGLEAAIDALEHEAASDRRDSLIKLASEMARTIRSIETMLAQARDREKGYDQLRVKLSELGERWSALCALEATDGLPASVPLRTVPM
jgi:thioesterase domain-containing protein